VHATVIPKVLHWKSLFWDVQELNQVPNIGQ
jgi:hypothetical protein